MAEREITEAQLALEFYAGPDNWRITDWANGIHEDCGRRAKDALAALGAAREPADRALVELIAAAQEWRDVIGGTLTVPPQAYLDAECRLASAVDNLPESFRSQP